MAGHVTRLESGQVLEAGAYFEGPWRSFARQVVEPHGTVTFEAVDAEYAIFVMTGEGEARVGAIAQSIDPGAALTVGYRASLILTAAERPLELFVTTLNVP